MTNWLFIGGAILALAGGAMKDMVKTGIIMGVIGLVLGYSLHYSTSSICI